MICKLCFRDYRKGHLAFVMAKGGRLQGMRVCQKCAADGVLVVAARPAEVKKPTKEPRDVRLGNVIKAVKAQLEVLKTHLDGHGDEYNNDDEFIEGKVEGMTNVLAMLTEIQR